MTYHPPALISVVVQNTSILAGQQDTITAQLLKGTTHIPGQLLTLYVNGMLIQTQIASSRRIVAFQWTPASSGTCYWNITSETIKTM